MSTQFILENRFQFNLLGLLFQKRRGTDRADCREFILWHHIGSLVMLPFHFSLIVSLLGRKRKFKLFKKNYEEIDMKTTVTAETIEKKQRNCQP